MCAVLPNTVPSLTHMALTTCSRPCSFSAAPLLQHLPSVVWTHLEKPLSIALGAWSAMYDKNDESLSASRIYRARDALHLVCGGLASLEQLCDGAMLTATFLGAALVHILTGIREACLSVDMLRSADPEVQGCDAPDLCTLVLSLHAASRPPLWSLVLEHQVCCAPSPAHLQPFTSTSTVSPPPPPTTTTTAATTTTHTHIHPCPLTRHPGDIHEDTHVHTTPTHTLPAPTHTLPTPIHSCVTTPTGPAHNTNKFFPLRSTSTSS